MLFGADGMLAGGPVAGVREIQAFVEDIVAELEAAPAEVLCPRTSHDHGPREHDHGHGHEHVHEHDQGFAR